MKVPKLDFVANIIGAICIWQFLKFAYITVDGLFETRIINLPILFENAGKVYMAFVYLVSGIGIIRRKMWARYLCIFVSLWSVINNLPLIYLLTREGIGPIAIIDYAVIHLVIIYFCAHRKLKQLFSERNHNQSEGQKNILDELRDLNKNEARDG